MLSSLGDLSLWTAAIGGYLLGSIPFGLVLTRLAGLGDIRQIGSRSIGATNVLRTGRKSLAAATLLLDGAKGAVAVLVFGAVAGLNAAVLAGGGAMLGHCFPVWLRLKGGKGVATALGILLAIAWPVGLLACLTWLTVAFLFRYSSAASLTAITLAPVYAWFVADLQRALLAILIAVLVWLRHHENIIRLAKGEESKIDLRGKAATDTEPAPEDRIPGHNGGPPLDDDDRRGKKS
ncbi:MAG: glycerol-3-phosphate 1-O-acyltransferase PlsY [Alphaproteobacteria bacterium]|nr:glycerol-3-phosphate 1-O-acyltransferase PlsY [Alphaproteobacteria bacterium]